MNSCGYLCLWAIGFRRIPPCPATHCCRGTVAVLNRPTYTHRQSALPPLFPFLFHRSSVNWFATHLLLAHLLPIRDFLVPPFLNFQVNVLTKSAFAGMRQVSDCDSYEEWTMEVGRRLLSLRSLPWHRTLLSEDQIRCTDAHSRRKWPSSVGESP